jgi:endonuclease YncB( thermonuclease family)
MDGDTFSVFNLLPSGHVKIRVKGVNTPEKNKAGFDEARRFTAGWLAKGTFKLMTCGKHTADALKQAGHLR